MTHGITFVIFFFFFDLAKRKLAPAIADLLEHKDILESSLFVGVGRSDFTSESYKEMLLSKQTAKVKNRLENLNIQYFRGDASKDLEGFSAFLEKHKRKNCSTIFYLATSFTLFGDIVKQLKKQKLHVEDECFTRIVFEKPFGFDSASHDAFEKEIHKVFKESQVYRIDHYLGKETVANLITLKYENTVFENLLNKENVDKIDIVVDEDLLVGSRVSYYNDFGATKDMIQSHLLQVYSLLLSDTPKELSTEKIHAAKVAVLKNTTVLPVKEHLLGSYEGYEDEVLSEGLEKKGTETFVKMGLTCSNERWKGVPVYLRTGKGLPEKYGQIRVQFKHNPKAQCKPNVLEINIQPNQDVNLYLNVKRNNACEDMVLNFCHDCKFGPNTKDGYEKMFREIIKGDHIMFTSVEENRYAWKILEDFEKIRQKIPFVNYPKGKDPEYILHKA
ncbi:MAG: hypothetical protein ACMXYK_02505 [Candidatus Woesearchaeota archaeon]